MNILLLDYAVFTVLKPCVSENLVIKVVGVLAIQEDIKPIKLYFKKNPLFMFLSGPQGKYYFTSN